MADNKKYYYLKLKDNFFDREEIKLIESLDNGYLYTNILMKLYLKSLKRDGKLMVTDRIPYSVKTIATVTGHNVDVVRNAIEVLQEFNLIDILDNGAMYMLDIQNFIGKSTNEADRKREYRKRIEDDKKLLKSGQMSDECPNEPKYLPSNADCEELDGQMSDKTPPEKEIESEREIELENRSSSNEEIEEEEQIKLIMKHCQKCELKLSKIKATLLLESYDYMQIMKAITKSVAIDNIKNPFKVVLTILENMEKQTIINNNYEGKGDKDLKFNNFEGRNEDKAYYDDLERKLLGWDDE